jgi:hypothetical protein
VLGRVLGRGVRETDMKRRDVYAGRFPGEPQSGRQRELGAARVQRRVRCIADEEQQTITTRVEPRGDAVAEDAAVARQATESRCERRARSESVLDEIERAARECLGDVDADRRVPGQRRREAPRCLCRWFRHARVRIRQVRQTRQPADASAVNSLTLHPRNQVRKDPRLYGSTGGWHSKKCATLAPNVNKVARRVM